jgi:hypothetical protein
MTGYPIIRAIAVSHRSRKDRISTKHLYNSVVISRADDSRRRSAVYKWEVLERNS